MADLYVAGGDGWTHLGETDGDIRFEAGPAVRALDDAAVALRLPVPFRFVVTDPAAVAAVYRVIHDLGRQQNPRRHGHCPTCHPDMDVRPLAVDGREYRRRQCARQRRRRHGR